MLKEFKEFALKGNVVDLAVAVIIGGAFGKIVTSLVNDVIMPPIGLLMGGVEFSYLSLVLKPATETVPEVAIHYGMFINTVINFIIIAFSIFMVVKQLKRFEKAEKPTVKAPSEDILLLTEIRDLLKKKRK